MIVGLKSSVPFVVRAIPKTKLTAELIQKEVEKTLSVVMDAGFNVSLLLIPDQSIRKRFFAKLELNHFPKYENVTRKQCGFLSQTSETL